MMERTLKILRLLYYLSRTDLSGCSSVTDRSEVSGIKITQPFAAF